VRGRTYRKQGIQEAGHTGSRAYRKQGIRKQGIRKQAHSKDTELESAAGMSRTALVVEGCERRSGKAQKGTRGGK